MFFVSPRVHLMINWLVLTLFAAFGVFVELCRGSARNQKKFAICSHSTLLVALHSPSKGILPPSQKEYRFRFLCHKFDSICRKYMQYLYLLNIMGLLPIIIFDD